MRRLAILLFLLGACGGGGGGGESTQPTVESSDDVGVNVSAPPWDLADNQAERMDAVGVPKLKAEGSLVHYHAHLDVFYDGEEVTVPANIGVDFEEAVISPLHTHFDSGVIHVEAEAEADFTLGQLLVMWGPRAEDGCIADKCGDEVAVFVNGSIQDVFAGDLVIKGGDQIALVLGTVPVDLPSEYDCATSPRDACPT